MNSSTATAPVTPTALRATDAERDACLDALKHSFEVGQLDQAELENRVESALKAVVRSDLTGLTVDLVVAPAARPVRAAGRRRIAAGVAAVTCLLAGVTGVAAGSFEEPPAMGACIASGLVTEADCPVPSPAQDKLIADVEAAADAAAQAIAAADGSEVDSEEYRWAAQAQAASERAASAGRDAQAIVAAAPGGEVGPQALKVPAATAREASQDAIEAALKAEVVVAESP